MKEIDERESAAGAVAMLISKVLGLRTVRHDTSIHNTLEWDSLAHLKMLDVLESHFGCQLDLEEVSEVQCVRDWIEVIDRHRR